MNLFFFFSIIWEIQSGLKSKYFASTWGSLWCQNNFSWNSLLCEIFPCLISCFSLFSLFDYESNSRNLFAIFWSKYCNLSSLVRIIEMCTSYKPFSCSYFPKFTTLTLVLLPKILNCLWKEKVSYLKSIQLTFSRFFFKESKG